MGLTPRFVVRRAVSGAPDVVHARLSDYARYPSAAPDHYEYVKVLSSRGGTSVSEELLRIGGREMLVTARHEIRDMFHGIYFVGGDAKGSSIEMRTRGDGGGTEVVMSVDLRYRMMRAKTARRDCERLLCMLV